MRALLLIALFYNAVCNAMTWDDLWWRKDQQGMALLNQGKNEQAAKVFENPAWKAAANYRAGKFLDSEKEYKRHNDPTSQYNLGNAFAKQGKLYEAIEAYDNAIKQQPNFKDAIFNRDLVKKKLEQQKNQPQDNKKNNDSQKQQSPKTNPQNNPSHDRSKQNPSSDQKPDQDNKNQNTNQNQDQQRSGEEKNNKPQNQADKKDNHNANQNDNTSDSEDKSQKDKNEKGNDTDKKNSNGNGSADDKKNQQDQNEKNKQDKQQDKQQGGKQSDLMNKQEENQASKANQGNMPAGKEQAQASKGMASKKRALDQETDQWLQQITDDPGDLLRRKIMRDHLKKLNRLEES